MIVYGECECFVMQMLYVCVLCASCGSSQLCVLHDLQFVNAGRRCNRRPYRRGILQSRFIVRSGLLVYSAGSGVNRVQVVCLDLVRGCFVLSRQKLCVGMVVCISWLHSYLCVWIDCDVVCIGYDLNQCTGWW